MTAHRILVTGSRHWADRYTVEVAIRQEALRLLRDDARATVVVVHGGASGADACAHVSARAMGFQVEEFRADWFKHGQAAGPFRNQEMVDAGADVCLAFPLPDSRGTWDCVRRCEKAGIPVRVFEQTGAVA